MEMYMNAPVLAERYERAWLGYTSAKPVALVPLDSLNVVNGIPFGGFGPSWLLPRQSASPSLSQALALNFIHTVDPAGMVTGTAQAVSVAVIIPSNIEIVNQ